MRTFKYHVLTLFSTIGLLSLPFNLKAQVPTPPSFHCENVRVGFTSSSASAPITATGPGAPRMCLPQCSTSVATCQTPGSTTITPVFSGLGTGVITATNWSVEGDIVITSAVTNGPTITIMSNVSTAAPFRFGKGRVKLTYSYKTGECGCQGFVTLDVFKRVNPLPTSPIVGPTCVAIGENVAYSIAPDFSRNVDAGIGLDNNYSWGSVTGFSSTPPTNYTAGDNSSQTYRVISAPTGLQNLTLKPGHNTTAGSPTIPGTGCNNLTLQLGPIKRRAASFNLTVSPTPITGYSITSNTTNQVAACIDGGVTTPCTLTVVSPEAGATYTFSSSPGGPTFVANPANLNHSVIVSPGATGAGVISCISSVPNGCGTASSTFTITRKISPTATLTQLSSNFPAPQGNIVCLRQNTTYTFQLSGAVANTPQGIVNSLNSGLPTALGNWSWSSSNNTLTLLTGSASGTGAAFNVQLNGVTCANGNIVAPNQYTLATNTPYTFTISPSAQNCGNFRATAPNFPVSCAGALYYSWSVTGGAVFIGNSQGCGQQNVQIDPNTVPVSGCTISCVITNTGCTIPGLCTSCQNFIPTSPGNFVIPNNSQPYLAGCRPGPGGENPKSALRAATDPDFEIDPNPTSVSLNVKLNSGKNQESTVSITDVSGKQVLSATKNSDEFTLDVSSLSKGVYIISINNSNGLKTKRFVKN